MKASTIFLIVFLLFAFIIIYSTFQKKKNGNGKGGNGLKWCNGWCCDGRPWWECITPMVAIRYKGIR